MYIFYQGTRDLQSLVVPVPSTVSALQNVAMAVSSSEPVIVSGHIGAGKTSLIEYLAYLTGRHNKLIKVRIATLCFAVFHMNVTRRKMSCKLVIVRCLDLL